jgi:hypothetical protein
MRVMLTFGMLLVAPSPSAARDEHGVDAGGGVSG